ncbi:EamA family transporter RarD [Gordonia sp. TBRC 11910]|uniref:EamA family transporter RarD n=1 Tax=Gordonia asplenii TaxID=2725283 RepID=A0A848KWP8_9ACTN|nr:EamA family transporter RarD [Gordonia asplenii]NMN99887.1 EamA family transporter RarD [Gordonia asplenii]
MSVDDYSNHRSDPGGLAAGIGAYVVWGCFPLFFTLLDRSGAVEVLAHRVVWTFVAMFVVLVVTRRVRSLLVISPRSWLIVASATALICLNWGTYIYAVNSGQVVECALGYFINPLVSVVFGVILFGERLRPLQVVALIVAAAAVVVITVDYGHPPVIALVLAFSFGLYGVLKKIVPLDPRTSLTAEGVVAAPFALGYLIVLTVHGASTFTQFGIGYAVLLAVAGPLTAVPLLLFGVAAQRIPLSILGILQYLTPTMQMLIGLFVLGESMTPVRWVGFGLIWVALVIFTAGSRVSRENDKVDVDK